MAVDRQDPDKKRLEDEDGDDIAAARDRVEDTSEDEDHVQYEEGFTAKTLIGAIFVGLIMAPGAIYLGLVAGASLGGAAQWVTIVLFAEVARRSFLPLKRQEIYVLYYVAGGLAGVGAHAISGGPFGQMIWAQYFIQSPQAATIVREIPPWVVPGVNSEALIQRTFLHGDWIVPISILLITQILERLSWIPAGYVLFRATSDVERLPFPLAPVAASGATALAEASTKEESWRWRVFSTGTTIGLVFGAFYIAIPVFTGVVFGTALTLIPIPYLDLMASTESIMPAAPTGLNGNLGSVLVGFVLPFSIVVGSVIASVIGQWFLNPIFYHQGMLPRWRPGMDTITTRITNNFDLWMSISIGTQVAIALIGLYVVIKGGIEASRGRGGHQRGAWSDIPRGRGDRQSTVKIALGLWLLATVLYCILTNRLLPNFPIWLLLTYAFLWTPLNSYVSARMYGLTSQDVNFPFLKQLTIMKSGYQNIDVWFAPMPLHDYGYLAQRFREVELTKTKFTSILKAEALMLPILLGGGFFFWQFIWNSSPVPSAQYPYALRMWPVQATEQSIWVQINKPGGATWVLDAIKPNVIGASIVGSLALYGIMFFTKAPMLAYYGALGGFNSLPHDTIPTFVGAMFGRYYFSKRIGVEKWGNYAPVLLAGFSCGTGLIGMAAIALALISKAVQPLPF